MADGHSAVQLITQLHDVLVQMDDLNDKQKSAILEQLAVSLQWRTERISY